MLPLRQETGTLVVHKIAKICSYDSYILLICRKDLPVNLERQELSESYCGILKRDGRRPHDGFSQRPCRRN